MSNLVLELDCGRVVIETFGDKAPKHVAQISELAESGFYDGLVFHRVISGFMAQGGCPLGTGTSGSGTHIPAEFNDTPHHRGVVSMARSSMPDSASSQFFICLDDANFLDNQYTAWGRVIEGMDVVDKITLGEPPENPTKIVTFRKA